jgi:hypothetical protein
MLSRALTRLVQEPQDASRPTEHLVWGARIDDDHLFALDVDFRGVLRATGMELPAETFADITLSTFQEPRTWRAESAGIHLALKDGKAELSLRDVTFVSHDSGSQQTTLGPWSGKIEGPLAQACQYLREAPPGSPVAADGARPRVYVDDEAWTSAFCSNWRGISN